MKNFSVLFVAVLLLSSCVNPFEVAGEKVDTDGDALSHEMIVLGDQLEDPYSVDVMTKALEAVYPTKAGRVTLDPTHIYVRFLPKDDGQFETLLDAGLQLLDHPVDYEILKDGDYYHDPDLPSDDITWQYAVVEPGFSFPAGIEYEILDECYIPEDTQTKVDGIDWGSVERMAYQLSGNEGMLLPETKAGSSNHPEGRITIVDETLGPDEFGVKGVTVFCNSFVKFGKAFTDDDGNYSISTTFSSNPRYRLLFKNKMGFGIGFNLLLVPASFSTLGKGEAGGLDAKITSSSERKLFTRCVVNNAAYDYYQQCKGSSGSSIKTPPSNLRIWLFQKLNMSSAVMMQQGVMVDEGTVSKFLGEYSFLIKMFLPDITLGLKGLDSYSDIYSVTVHELAHASHFMTAGKTFWNEYVNYIITSFVTSGFVTYGVGTEDGHGYCEVGEMWAYYIETKLFRERYKDADKTFGGSYWFTPQILLTLDERGLTRYMIFQALTSDVTEKSMLQKKLVSLYPEFKSAINQTFTRYN